MGVSQESFSSVVNVEEQALAICFVGRDFKTVAKLKNKYFTSI